ncbi:SETMR methyltransferase, partial [Acromyrmex heyeri]
KMDQKMCIKFCVKNKLSYISKFTHDFGSENVFSDFENVNSDQSGFQLKIHSGKSLSNLIHNQLSSSGYITEHKLQYDHDFQWDNIKILLDNVHSTSAPAFVTVYNWMNRRVKVRELVEATGISHGTMISILHEQLSMKKLSVRWVPHLLTVDHKRDRVTIPKQCLEMFQRNPDEFLRRFITVNETWIHYSHPRRRNNQNKLAGKVMATVFWDAVKKRLHLAKKKVLFHQNNARVHTCPAPMVKFNEFLFKQAFEGLGKLYYSDGLKKLENRWIKCIELKGDY